MKKAVLVFLIFMLSPVFISEAVARDIIVFFDISGSITKEIKKEYLAGYRDAVSDLKAGDAVAAALIDSNTRGSFKPTGQLTVRAKGITESPTGYEEEVDSAKTESILRVKKMLTESKPSGGTDILSVLTQARDYFTRSGGATGPKMIVIFSDMVEETKGLNLRGITPKQVDAAFNKVKDGLPRLQGVKIFAVGAKGQSPENYQALEGFWKKVFASAGGECVFFGATLYDFGKWVK